MTCGPSKYDKFIPDLHFAKCCKIHDEDYDLIIKLGVNLARIRIQNSYSLSIKSFIYDQIKVILAYHQKQADLRFLDDMLNHNINVSSGLKRKLYDLVAYTYYYAVKEKGIDIIMSEVIK